MSNIYQGYVTPRQVRIIACAPVAIRQQIRELVAAGYGEREIFNQSRASIRQIRAEIALIDWERVNVRAGVAA